MHVVCLSIPIRLILYIQEEIQWAIEELHFHSSVRAKENEECSFLPFSLSLFCSSLLALHSSTLCSVRIHAKWSFFAEIEYERREVKDKWRIYVYVRFQTRTKSIVSRRNSGTTSHSDKSTQGTNESFSARNFFNSPLSANNQSVAPILLLFSFSSVLRPWILHEQLKSIGKYKDNDWILWNRYDK